MAGVDVDRKAIDGISPHPRPLSPERGEGGGKEAAMFCGRAAVLLNRQMASKTWVIRLEAPELASAIRPGQFLMLRVPGHTDPLLGRPFALYDTVLDLQGNPVAVDVVYLVVGKVTGLLAGLRPGDTVEVWGPLGNGFPDLTGVDHVGLVAGGIGQTPFLANVRNLLGQRGYGGRPPCRQCQQVSLFYGVRTADLAAGVDDFSAAGARVHLASDDGSLGFRGFVTQLLAQHIGATGPRHLVGCGPEPMLRALADLAQLHGLPCHISLETPMACGLGICFSCVAKIRSGDGWDYCRVCIEGPVFDATAVQF
jgi:dihydroorotate dehydrogenase electron transfer subunit